MEEFAERGDLRRMQREQERERRRIRDRERRQSMTQEQRERHLARRRRNYQLRRQRAANAHHNHHHQLHLGANAQLVPLPNNLPLVESSAGEASTSDDLQGVTSSTTSLDYSVILALPGYALNQGQETLNLGTQDAHQGSSSVQLETLAYKPADSARRLRLNQIKHLARNLIGSMVDTADTHLVAVELKTTEDASVRDSGSTPKSLRLNSVKRLARSINAPSKETPIQKDNNLAAEEGVQLLDLEIKIDKDFSINIANLEAWIARSL